MRPGAPDPECAAWVDDLSTLALQALSGPDRDRLVRHLEGCTSCSAELETWSAVAEALYALVPTMLDCPDLAPKVIERIAREESQAPVAGGRRPRLGSSRRRRSP